jgi:UDP-glucose 4-epimerase
MACPAARGRVFNLGNDEAVTIRELAERVVRVVNPALEIRHISYTEAYGEGFDEIRDRVPNLRRVRDTIGYRPRHSLDDVIREVVAWKRQTAVPQ